MRPHPGFLLTLALVGCGRDPADPGPTAMFRGDSLHSGRYDEPIGPELQGLAWRFETGGGVISSPTVLGDTVWIGSDDGHLYALDRRTGSLRWTADLESPVSSTPAVARGLVVVGTRDGRFVALGSTDGRPRWSVETGPDLPFPWGHESGDRWTASPVVAGEQVFVASGDGSVRALDLASGSVGWIARTGGRIRSSPAVGGGLVVVGSADGHVYGFDRGTGAERWRHATEGAMLESGNFGFDRRTIQSSPAIDGSTVYVGARDGFLYAVELATGTRRWRVDHRVSWINASPALGPELLYVGTSDGRFVQAVDKETGEERWRVAVGATAWSSPALVGDQLLVGDGQGRVRALDGRDGSSRWSFTTGAGVFSSPVPGGDLVIVGSLDGSVYALRTGQTPVVRAVFDDRPSPTPGGAGEPPVTAALQERGYRVLDAAGVEAFLTDRIADRRPSVLVLASPRLPASIVGRPLSGSLLRHYLDAGGKVVWPNRLPPLLVGYDPESGLPTGGLATFDWDASGELLGMATTRGIFDARRVRPTEAGRRAGLQGSWLDAWGIELDDVSVVYALDDWRLAASWLKSFGGAPGTGWVRAPADQLEPTYLLAELRPSP